MQLPGFLSLSTKLFPTIMNLLKRLAEEGQKPSASDPRMNPELELSGFKNGKHSDSKSDASSNITSSKSRAEHSGPLKQEQHEAIKSE